MVATMVPTIIYTREIKIYHLEYGYTVATVVSIKGHFLICVSTAGGEFFKKMGTRGPNQREN